MKRWTKRTAALGASLSALGAGCATPQPTPIHPPITIRHPSDAVPPKRIAARVEHTVQKTPASAPNPIRQASATQVPPGFDPPKPAAPAPLPAPAPARPILNS